MSSKNETMVVDTFDKSGEALQLTIKTPGHKTFQEAQMVYNVD